MRIGIIPGVDPSDGGIYQYSLTMLEALHHIRNDFPNDDFVTLAIDPDSPLMNTLRTESWSIVPLLPPTWKRRAVRVVERVIGAKPKLALLRLMKRTSIKEPERTDLDRIQHNTELRNWFELNRIELMIYPISTSLSFEATIPYILAVHDLQHRLQPEFPEVSAKGEWEKREYLFRNGLRNATLILADSETGKEDILNYYGKYGVHKDRIKVLPFITSSKLQLESVENEKVRTKKLYDLPERYLFYPAQFWPHKNHKRIIEALALLRRSYGLEIPIALSGSYGGAIREKTFNEMKDAASNLGLSAQIRYLGYIPDEDMSGLYSGAVALIMPTFFGPTNIPVLEAWALDCPVLTSDIRGIREQAGDAAILVDPASVESIAEGIRQLWEDDDLRQTLIRRGRERGLQLTPSHYRNRLIEILREAKGLVQNGMNECALTVQKGEA